MNNISKKKGGVGGGERRPPCHSQIRCRPLDGPETMVLCQKPMESSLLLLFEKTKLVLLLYEPAGGKQ